MYAALIDTIIWTSLLDDPDGDDVISVIERLQREQIIIILLPNTIPEEWQNNSPKRVPEKGSEFAKQIGLVPKSKAALAEIVRDEVVQRKRALIGRIEAIFDGSIQIEPSDTVGAVAIKRFRKKMPPYHNNQRSNNDALMYLSALEWCQENNISLLHFVTHNHNDFAADPIAIQKVIHPDLLVSEVSVKYYDDVKRLLLIAEPTCFTSSNAMQFFSAERPIRYSGLENQPLIDQWTAAFDYYYQQLPYVPMAVISRAFPIRISAEEHLGFSGRAIYTDNKELIELLKTLGIPTDRKLMAGQPQTVNIVLPGKVKEVFSKLNNSHLISIYWQKEHIGYDCYIGEQPGCHCIRCSYRRLDFKAVLTDLRFEPAEDVYENLRQGYVHFKLGNYLKAFQFYRCACKQTEKNRLFVLHLICAQNLDAIKQIIQWLYHYSDAAPSRKTNVDVEAIFIANLERDDFIRETSKLVYNNNYFDSAYFRIAEYYQKILEHYDSQLEGGFSSNKHLVHLMVNAGELNDYLAKNSIVSHYANDRYRELYKLVLEAYFKSHAINEQQTARLANFFDDLLFDIAGHAEPKVIRQKLKGIHYKTLQYRYPDNQPSLFVERAESFLDGLKDLKELQEKYGEAHYGQTFKGHYINITGNLLTLASKLVLKSTDDKRIATAIIHAIANHSSFPFLVCEVEGGLTFLNAKPSAFTVKQLKKLTAILATQLEQRNSLEWLNKLGFLIEKRHSTIIQKDKALSKLILDNIIEFSKKENLSDRFDTLTIWYQVLHSEQKKTIGDIISRELKKQFSPDVFYNYAIYGIIDYRLYLKEFANAVPLPNENQIHFFGGRNDRSYRLNDLINLAFTFSIDTSAPLFKRFKNCNHYYDWLFDMDNFNYDLFNIDWVMEYKTNPYFAKIFGHPKCQTAIRNALNKNYHPAIAREFIRYSTTL